MIANIENLKVDWYGFWTVGCYIYAYKQTPYLSHSKLGCDNLKSGTNLVMTRQNKLKLVRKNGLVTQIYAQFGHFLLFIATNQYV